MFQASRAVSGYLCSDLDVMCFASTSTDKQQYWTVVMKTLKFIRHILYQGNDPLRIKGKQIRAGLDPDIFSDPVVVTNVQFTANFYLQSYEFDPPIPARYIGFTGPDNMELGVCTMMAFE